jgi:L-threonylcarbamoyladenylate synthase
VRRLNIDDLIASPERVFELRELLGHGGLLAIPTETYYALAADPDNDAGVRRIFAAKGRDDGKPLPVLFGTRAQLERMGVNAEAAALDHFFQIWPAPLTVVLPVRRPLAASRGVPTLGVRLPASRNVRALLAKLGPVTGTSLNRSGRPPLADPDEIEAHFRRDIDVLVDGGRTPGGKPSTVVDATEDPPAVLREGAFPWPARGSRPAVLGPPGQPQDRPRRL